MRNGFGSAIMLCLLAAGVSRAEPLPAHPGTRLLTNGSLVVEVMDPAATPRYNSGIRFSPVGFGLRAQLQGKEFLFSPPVASNPFGDAAGLAMEFDLGEGAMNKPPGYNEAPLGGQFLKIGVGILQRNTANAYGWFLNYPVIERATTTVNWQPSSATFIQTLNGNANGYSYRLEETMSVVGDQLIQNYRLFNTGTKQFTTEQYVHNFLSFEGRQIGPNYTVAFPYDFTVTGLDPQQTKVGRSILFNSQVDANNVKPIISTPLGGYTGANSLLVTQSDVNQSLRIDASLPSNGVAIFASKEQLSPEMNVLITLLPGQDIQFSRTYTFAVPEPATWISGAVGGVVLACYAKRRVLCSKRPGLRFRSRR